MKFYKAFALMEVMVVITIIAILTAIAVPFYGDYISKSRVALAALVLNELNTKAMALYNEGLISPGMSQLDIDGTIWTDGATVPYDRYPVVSAEMYFPGAGTVNDNAWMFCVRVADLSITGYTGPTGDKSRLCSKVVVDSGIFTTYCGCFDPNNPVDIPVDYLPEQCNVASVSAAS